MFEAIPRLFITKVQVPVCLSICRADTGWFDRYVKEKDDSFIADYWNGVEYPGGGWEFLVDGVISFSDPAELEHLRQNRAKLVG